MNETQASASESSESSGAPDISIVILSWNTRELTCACLDSIFADGTALELQVIVVDNASGDGSADAIAERFPGVELLRNDENRFYAEGNNQGAELATGKYLCLLNSDTVLKPGTLDQLHGFLAGHPEYGAVSPKLLHFDGRVQDACMRFPGLLDPLVDSTVLGEFWPGSRIRSHTRMDDFDHLHSRDVDQPPGTCMLMPRSLWLELGGFDPELELFFNDVDLCQRIWASGKRIRFLAEAEIFHHLGASTAHHTQQNRNTRWFRNRTSYYGKRYGALGRWWARFVFRLWALQISMGIRLGPREKAAKREALKELRSHVRSCLDA